jgi:hypothetical protein
MTFLETQAFAATLVQQSRAVTQALLGGTAF